jgi:non-specific protein-tyrosine kinase
VLLCGLIGGGTAYALAKKRAPVYRATTLLVVNEHSSNGDPYTNTLASAQLLQTYLKLIETPAVVNQAAKLVPGSSSTTLSANLRVSNPGVSTQIIEIQVDNTSPRVAAALANAVATTFIAVSGSVLHTNDLSVFQSATPPTSPDHPSPRLYGEIGFAAGVLLGAGLALLVEMLDDRVRTAADVERVIGLVPIVGLPSHSRAPDLTSGDGGQFLPDSFRMVRSGLDASSGPGPSSNIVVTSAMAGEGKTTVALNLATSFARAGKRTLLIDANIRDPAIHALLGLPNDDGLTTCLRPEDQRVGRNLPCVQVPGLNQLWVLTAGPRSATAADALGSSRMQQILDSLCGSSQLASLVDVVVTDTAPAADFADASALAAYASSTLLIVNGTICREGELLRAYAALCRVEARIAGVVMNQVSTRDMGNRSDGLGTQRTDEPLPATGMVSELPDHRGRYPDRLRAAPGRSAAPSSKWPEES